MHYLPPELLLEQKDAVGVACDIWALGCTLFEIRQQIPLFYMMFDAEDTLIEMVQFLGKMPQHWWDEWKAHEKYFDESGKHIIPRVCEEEWSLEVYLSKPRAAGRSAEASPDEPVKQMSTPAAEQRLMADLLYKIFRYEPEKRLIVAEVMDHDWFKL